MDFWSTLILSLLLLLVSAGLMVWHVRAWRKVRQKKQLEPRELDYRRRQYRRRMQTTAMVALLAVALLAGFWITPQRVRPWVFFAYWGGTLLVVLWVGLLAAADIIATKYYFSRLRQNYLIEQAKLHAIVRRIRARRNGKGQRDSAGGSRKPRNRTREEP